MLKQLLATLLLVIISSSQCISSDDEYKRMGWTANKHIDDLTDEITSYNVRLDYHKSEPLTFYDLSVECDMQEKELDVTIFGGSAQSRWLMSIAGVGSRSENVTVEYRFNQESVLKEVWEKTKTGGVFTFKPLHPVSFAHELLRVMEGDKAQFRFREIDRKTLHFDLHGGAPFVRAVLDKCDALPEKEEE